MLSIIKLFGLIMISIVVLGIITAFLGCFLDRKIFGKVSTIYVFLGVLMTIFGVLSLIVIKNGLFGMIFLFDFSFLLVLVVAIYLKMIKG